jgi:hypothetical protein
VVSGPAAVAFDNAASSHTLAHFSTAGIYVLRLTSNDGAFSVQDEMTVTVSGGDAYAAWKATYFTAAELANPSISGDDADPDGDSLSNSAEFIAGTNPRDAQSYLGLGAVRTETGLDLRFEAMPGRAYDVFTRETVDSGAWDLLRSMQPSQTQQSIQINVDPTLTEPGRFFKIGIPAQP